MSQQIFEATPVWQRLFVELDRLDDEGLASLHFTAKYWRANLPGEWACLVGVLDTFRDLALALAADRKGMTVEQIEAVVSAALAEGGESDR